MRSTFPITAKLCRTSFTPSIGYVWSLFCTFFILTLCGCNSSVAYHQFRPVDVDNWYIKDTLRFDIPASSLIGDYTLSVGLRYQQDYAYRNVWVVVEQDYTTPTYKTRDTLEVVLADEADRLKGRGTSLLQIEQPCTSVHLAPRQHATIKVYHITRPEHISGISDVGIRLSRD